MISRRIIRVKVMQTLYTLDTMDGEIMPEEAVSILEKKMEQSRLLFTYLIYCITEVAKYAEKDAVTRANKHLPSAEDLNVNTKIAGNQLVWKIIEDSAFKSIVKNFRPELVANEELIKKIYITLTESEVYNDYVETASRDKKSERLILEHIFNNLMLPQEEFVNHVEEHFINWDDDAEMMQSLVTNYLQKPTQSPFHDILGAEKWAFAKSLASTVLDKKEQTHAFIKPKLKNWDADRIAALDYIILQMGICEFLYFETIPTKVTINEYIDIAKAYSTPQSGQFVNGLLDNIHKELMSENRIDKQKYKNSTY